MEEAEELPGDGFKLSQDCSVIDLLCYPSNSYIIFDRKYFITRLNFREGTNKRVYCSRKVQPLARRLTDRESERNPSNDSNGHDQTNH